MATTPTTIPTSAFSPITASSPGQPVTRVANLIATLVAPDPAPINTAVATIQQAIASDKAANTPGGTPLQPPDNFTFTDLTVNVRSSTPGDAFKGTTPGISSQVVDLTPDNLLIQAVTPNAFIKADPGNDVLTATGGRNILSAGSGFNVMSGGGGQDTFLADASNASSVAFIENLGAGDDVAMLGVTVADFSFSVKDTPAGLELDATPTAASKPSAQIILAGHTVADIGSKLTLGVSSTTDGTSFLFFHAS